MPRRPSEDFFNLVKSLSSSEWSTVHQILNESLYRGNKKGQKRNALKDFLVLLRQSDNYSETSLRSALAIPNTSKGNTKWKNIKRHSEPIVFSAIERAPANQTPENMAERFSLLLKHLIQRGIFIRAQDLIEKYLLVARAYEFFDLEKVLLDHKNTILSILKDENEGGLELEKAILRRRQLWQIIQEIEEFIDLRNRLKLAMNLPVFQRKDRIVEIGKDPILGVEGQKSTKAKVLRLDILRQIHVIAGRTAEFSKAQVDILDAFKQFPNHFNSTEMIFSVVLSHYDQFHLKLMAHRFEGAQESLGKLRSLVDDLQGDIQSRAKELYRIASFFKARVILDEKRILEETELLARWYKVNPHFKSRKRYALSAYSMSEAHFALGNYSKSIRWLSEIKNREKSKFNPPLLLMSVVLTCICRIEMFDSDGLEYEVRVLIKLMKLDSEAGEVFQFMISHFKKWITIKGHTEQGPWFKAFAESILPMLKLRKYSWILNYFDFALWLKSKEEKKPFILCLKEASKPFENL